MLIVFGGLPGTGKSTIACALAERTAATYLRIDVIEQAIRASGVLAGDVGPAGYHAAMALAEANLRLGRTVISDSVNPIALTRRAWEAVAERCGAPLIDVEIVCSDPAEHRRRVEQRQSTVDGLILPTWQQVTDRHYEPWEEAHLIIDTARLSPDAAVATIERHMAETPRPRA
jgi:predicted kinase